MRPRHLHLVVLAGVLCAGGALVPAVAADEASREVVLSPEGNHLWAYDAHDHTSQLVSLAVNGTPPAGVDPATWTGARYDINGQVCVSPDGQHIVTGEDTVYHGTGGDGGSSHDPRIAGWGWFEISGDGIGSVAIEQRGKLAPEAEGTGDGYTGDPDNFGCGFLDAHRLVTTAIGNTLPGEPANGQLFVWFAGDSPEGFETGFERVTDDTAGVAFNVGAVAHCSVDDTLATAGGIAVAPNGDVFVATNRFDDANHPGGVWRYRNLPESQAECESPDYAVDKELVIPGGPVTTPDVPIVPSPRAFTPSAVVISPESTLVVSSVFTGSVAEFTMGGTWIRDLYPLAPVTPYTGPTGDTPFGVTFTSDHALWIADLGIVLNGPVPGLGSVIRVTYDDQGNPVPGGSTRVAEGLTFPDGIGVWRPVP